ncbi:hypothetical protein K9M78_02465 [Candidatus Bipolaricaulota bacterium]|nr:hypothetical protein [Candidatus Bipolaricaulota bacterium]
MSRNDLELSLACGDHEITRPIQTGEVKPEGIDWEVSTPYAPERHWRMIRETEFDVCELSLGSYLASRSIPDDHPFTAIPVFPHRHFRHSYMFKSSNTSIEDPGDLTGKKVGLNTWQTTAGIWMRGIASEEYGLDLESVTWYRRAPEDVPLELSGKFDIHKIPEDRNLEEMLSEGYLQGAFYPALLDSVKRGKGCERIFENPFQEEKNYYRETGIFPLMHAIVIRDKVLEKAPWAAESIYEAFKKSRDIGLKKLEDPRTQALVWARKYLEEEQSLFGGSPWSYGLTEENLRVFDKLQEYSLRQEIIPSRYDLENLFVRI